MADHTHKLSENVPGAWYIDDTCTPCRVCLDVPAADQIMKYNDDETYVYFYKQPENNEELEAANEAMAICPQVAIGNDGE
jgi:ferredoxin